MKNIQLLVIAVLTAFATACVGEGAKPNDETISVARASLETSCTGGTDDDLDGLVDCVDPDCSGNGACTDRLACSRKLYQVAASGGNSGFLSFKTSTNPWTLDTIGADVGFTVNSAGYRKQDGYIYAMKGSDLVRINKNGVGTNLGAVTGGSFAGGTNVGDFDGDGYLWVKSSNSTSSWKIDVATRVATAVTAVATGADWAYRADENAFYSVNNTNQIVIFDLDTLTSRTVAITGALVAGGHGADWFDADGILYAFDNGTGYIRAINADTGAATFVGTAPPNSSNDGASCPLTLPPFEGCANGEDDDGDGTTDENDDPLDPEGNNCVPFRDSDGDSEPNATDVDDDNDGIPDIFEVGDTDSDGVPDRLDLDSDNDGIPDIAEAGHDGPDATNNSVVDGPYGTNGFADTLEVTADDGAVDYNSNGVGGDLPRDTDGDGHYDFQDLDSDNDGILDLVEAGHDGTDAAQDGLVDGAVGTNGIPDALEVTVDNGVVDYNSDNTGGDDPADTDSDGVPDYRDLDSDNDGLSDVYEAGLSEFDEDDNGVVDYSMGGDADEDGIAGIVDGNVAEFGDENVGALPNPDGGEPSFRDLDSDGDGQFDVDEENLGVDGNNDGKVDGTTDTDGDGVPNSVDDADSAFGGLGQPDADGDGVPNASDIDDDNDGVFDTNEANDDQDADSDGAGPDIGDDRDGDGIASKYDLDSDGDGIFDLIEGNDSNRDGKNDNVVVTDNNNNGVIDTVTDTNNNGAADSYDSTPASRPNTDVSGHLDYLDPDDDGDGINTVDECTMATCEDSDGDDIPDYLDTCGDGTKTGTEACDDGNATAGDGCTAACLVEVQYACSANSDCGSGYCNVGISDVCVRCLDSATGTSTDTGCGGGTPFCDTGVAGFECVACVDDAMGISTDSGCDSNEPVCLESGVNACAECATGADCNDSDVCTDDICSAGVCGHTNNTASCDDGNLCTTTDVCSGGSCAGSAVVCNDGLNCTTDACNPSDGSCDETVNSGCAIASACWTDGQVNPMNGCEVCDASESKLLWTLKANCEPCTENANCTDGTRPVCDVGSGTCVACVTGMTDYCGGTTPICDVDANTCEGCVSDGQCGGMSSDTPACDIGTGECFTCTGDNDSACSGSTPACKTDTHECVECTVAEPDACVGAEAGEACVDNACGCSTNNDCALDQICNAVGKVCVFLDSDHDGVNDTDDADSDNDGIPDVVEGGGVDPSQDSDNDGVPDYLDDDTAGFVDTNVDGVDDRYDADGDGVPNNLDLDSDNDGVTDVVENSGTTDLDMDNDGRLDETVDLDDDGLVASVDLDDTSALVMGTKDPASDTDMDGVLDINDLDSDGDGIPDIIEGSGTDSDFDGRVDGDTDADIDGWNDAVDPSEGGTPWAIPDSDMNGDFDFQDLDSDGDGVSDTVEAYDFDGDGAADVTPVGMDTDGDGLDDAFDTGDELELPNSDDDEIPDYRDDDDDNDGVDTKDELGDTNGNGIPDYLEGEVVDDGGVVPDGGTMMPDASPDGGKPPVSGGFAGGALCAASPSTQGGGMWGGLLVMVAAVLFRRRRPR